MDCAYCKTAVALDCWTSSICIDLDGWVPRSIEGPTS